mmetsp:Transcript_1766/g.3195  ORF Transcript_1766/g.3195 Transcript_1766/m.3195 type:complete len:206 (+) Transcript_1766:1027-1644(+)
MREDLGVDPARVLALFRLFQRVGRDHDRLQEAAQSHDEGVHCIMPPGEKNAELRGRHCDDSDCQICCVDGEQRDVGVADVSFDGGGAHGCVERGQEEQICDQSADHQSPVHPVIHHKLCRLCEREGGVGRCRLTLRRRLAAEKRRLPRRIEPNMPPVLTPVPGDDLGRLQRADLRAGRVRVAFAAQRLSLLLLFVETRTVCLTVF